MGYDIRPLKEFLVRPKIPEELQRLEELAYNLVWTWEPAIAKLFQRLDPRLWEASNKNPVWMLAHIPQEALEQAARDPRFVAMYRRACERYDAYMARPQVDSDMLVAYFSMEFGLASCLPMYSGGLGLLAGDHLKAASDMGVNLVGVGLLYQRGYLRQVLNPDGWQTERSSDNDFYTLPVQPVRGPDGKELLVEVTLPTGTVWIKVWEQRVGRVRLFLLDTNIPQNTRPEHRDITDQLYGGDIHTRIRQEIVLGVGGLRSLRKMGLRPTVYHMNEGHSAFLALERIRILMQERGLSFKEALLASRANNVFTTHTSLPAGIDLFDPGLMYQYFHAFCEECGIPFEELLALGRVNPLDRSEPFSMPIAAIATSSYRNAVSRLHREVSQRMWHALWPQLPVWEVPISHITNGVHLLTWISPELASLYDQYLQPDWRERYSEPGIWELVDDIPDTELWEAHRAAKRRLVEYVRARVRAAALERRASSSELRRLAEVLDPNVFTIGFARRFAAYKRPGLIFQDFNRLKQILNHPDMPVQIVIAGKAHPEDHPGKELIHEIVRRMRDPEVSKRIVFVEDYDIELARYLVQGVDLWLNTPRRGQEACGTSGMKAGINGVLNCSVLDGWYDEAFELTGGWAIGQREPYSPEQDVEHARELYSLLENEIVPLFYSTREDGVPEEWVRRAKISIKNLSPTFTAARMLGQYLEQFYRPAHRAYMEIRRQGFQTIRQRAQWLEQVSQAWDSVRFLKIETMDSEQALSGQPIPLRVVVDLGSLSKEDVRVEAVVGRINADGVLEDTEVIVLPPVEEDQQVVTFARQFVPHLTGRLGYAVRIMPNHVEDPLTRPCRSPVKWG